MIGSSQRPPPDITQHSQQRDIHATGGFRTRNLSRRAAADHALDRAATGIDLVPDVLLKKHRTWTATIYVASVSV